MSLLIGVSKLAFLAILWVFIVMIARVIKRDVYGSPEAESARPGTKPNPKRRGGRARKAQLVVVEGPGRGDSVPLSGEVVVGRSPECALDIEDDFASGRHARFYQDAESWIVADLGSTNGTIVNGQRITRPTRVGDGDIVRLGHTSVRVEAP